MNKLFFVISLFSVSFSFAENARISIDEVYPGYSVSSVKRGTAIKFFRDVTIKPSVLMYWNESTYCRFDVGSEASHDVSIPANTKLAVSDVQVDYPLWVPSNGYRQTAIALNGSIGLNSDSFFSISNNYLGILCVNAEKDLISIDMFRQKAKELGFDFE